MTFIIGEKTKLVLPSPKKFVKHSKELEPKEKTEKGWAPRVGLPFEYNDEHYMDIYKPVYLENMIVGWRFFKRDKIDLNGHSRETILEVHE